MIRREVALIGTASPRPTPATAVLMPMTRPRESASAPPELPGLRAASVWMTSSTIGWRCGCGSAATAQPADDTGGDAAGHAERVADGDHQRSDLQVVHVAVDRRLGDRPVRPDDRQSASGSRPTISSLATLPSANVASPVSALPTTWALVIRWPSPVSATPTQRPPRTGPAGVPGSPPRAEQLLGHARDHLRVRVQRVVVGAVVRGRRLSVPWPVPWSRQVARPRGGEISYVGPGAQARARRPAQRRGPAAESDRDHRPRAHGRRNRRGVPAPGGWHR